MKLHSIFLNQFSREYELYSWKSLTEYASVVGWGSALFHFLMMPSPKSRLFLKRDNAVKLHERLNKKH